ncbi:MAG: hypothetical protein KatS3mg023_0096 [Armatimonadota bacterium]|nr:MAG: hypothetical protein KatS3mg023_0096 [Armatimonadota bacterium]
MEQGARRGYHPCIERSGEHIDAEVLGPVQAPIPRLRGLWRWHCLVKCYQPEVLPDLLRDALDGVSCPQGGTLQVDIDPYSLL